MKNLDPRVIAALEEAKAKRAQKTETTKSANQGAKAIALVVLIAVGLPIANYISTHPIYTPSTTASTPITSPVKTATGNPEKDVVIDASGCATIPLSYVPAGVSPQKYKEVLKAKTGARCIFWDVNR